MRSLIFSAILMLMVSFKLIAQTDTIHAINLLDEISSNDKDSMLLLPTHIMPTQRLLWGEKGLMRHFDYFELTAAKRQNELKIRRHMLITHQAMGFATLGVMVAQGIVGARLYNGRKDLRDLHETLGAIVNFCYFTTASLALFAPPKMLDERKGYSSIKLHAALAVIHLSCMIATNVLAGQLESNPKLRSYHRATAYTAFGSFAAAMIVIKF